ncbi:hypothetical protein [Anthocerotibacter panamensis]|uniref:hypothetical protein n=1 Tax=Anthocerotibacter panamensis TaxID=2857077 RepID=UPI001C4088EF|nr:hypothetical protein [Anthocerotibacter panamensis]
MNSYPPDLLALKKEIARLTKERNGDLQRLIELLNLLEECYIMIRDGAYMQALPQTRKDLYQTLVEMEEQGTWPILPRNHIQTLLAHLRQLSLESEDQGAQHVSEDGG